MAAVAYRMLTGNTLFGRHTLATLAYKLVNEAPSPVCAHNPAIPAGVDKVLSKALAKAPSDRYPSCGTFVEELAAAWSGSMDAPTAALAPVVPATSTTANPRKQRAGKAALIAGGILVAVAGATVALWKPARQPEPPPTVHVDAPEQPVSAPPPVTEKPVVVTHPKPVTPAKTPARQPPQPPEPPANLVEFTPPPAPSLDTPQPNAPQDTPFHRGLEALRSKDYPAAVREFTIVIGNRPKFGAGYYDRALAHQFLGENLLALQDYSDAVRVGHRDARTYASRGICEARAKQDDAAFADFNQALSIDAKNPAALNGRGNVFYRRRQYQLAIRDFTAAISANPQFATAYQNRANARKASGDSFGAADDFAIAQRLKQSGK
jgi:Tfp pilus assembly protein PilF